jgi:hypothetical protein
LDGLKPLADRNGVNLDKPVLFRVSSRGRRRKKKKKQKHAVLTKMESEENGLRIKSV